MYRKKFVPVMGFAAALILSGSQVALGAEITSDTTPAESVISTEATTVALDSSKDTNPQEADSAPLDSEQSFPADNTEPAVSSKKEPSVEKGSSSKEQEPTPSASISTSSEAITADDGKTEETSQGTLANEPEDNESSSPSEDEQAVEPALADGTYVIETECGNGQVLDVANGSTGDGANVQSYGCNMTGAQKWKVTTDKKGLTSIVNVKSGKALDVEWGAAQSGTNVWQYTANGTNAQKWRLVREGSWWKIASALDSGLVLDVAGQGSTNGTNLQVYKDNGTIAQRFLFLLTNPIVAASATLPEDGYYTITSSVDQSHVLDVTSATNANGANVQSWSPNGTFAQTWSFVRSGDYYLLKSACSDRVLDVENGKVIPGANVQTWAADTRNGNQLFSATKNEDGTYTFTNVASGLALDVVSGSKENGANIQAWTPNGTAAQRWTLRKVLNLINEGLYELTPRVSSGQRIDVANGSTQNNGNVWTYSSNGTPAQKWRVENRGDNEYAFRSVGSGLFLAANGDNVVQSSSLDDSSTWRVDSISAGYVTLRNVKTNKMLDISSAGTSNGTNVQVYAANGTAAQQYRLTPTIPVSEGTYILRLGANGGLALDVASGSTSSGANVQVYQSNNTGAQKWVLKSLGDGVYRITNAQSNCALDVANGNASSGANVWQWTDNGTNAQRWRIEYTGGAGTFYIVSCLNEALKLSTSQVASGANAQLSDAHVSSFTFEPTTYTPPKPKETYPWAIANMINRSTYYSSATNWLAMVDTANNYAGFFTRSNGGWSLYKWTRVSTGASNSPTVIGQYTVGSRGYSFSGGDHTCYWYTQFYGDYLFHSVLYHRGTHNVLDGRLGINISGGCVRMDINDAKWVYDNIPYRTKVVTYRG